MLRISIPLSLALTLTACNNAKDPGDSDDSATTTPATSGTGGGSETSAGDSGDPAHGDCDQYIECVGAVSPENLEAAKSVYGPGGTCWTTSPEVKEGCLKACTSALQALGAAYPDEPSCGGAGSTSGQDATSDSPTEPNTSSNATPASDPSDSFTSDSFTSDSFTSDSFTSDPSDSFTSDPSDSFTSDPSDSDPSDSDPSGTGGGFGACGWDANNNWYGCAGVPGLEDPQGMVPIQCPDNLQEGMPCDDNGPVTGVGCCTSEGDNYYCARGSIFREGCGF